MKEEDIAILSDMMKSYSIKDILECLADLSLSHASEMSDLQCTDCAKEWSVRADALKCILEIIK